MSNIHRCGWCGDDPLYVEYHDKVWGKPVYNDKELFAKLILDGAQAGLSWITILRKQENYYEAFDQFDAEKIAQYDENKVEELLQNEGIIRNQLKIRSTISNAQAYLAIQENEGFSNYLWNFVNDKPIINEWQHYTDAPAKTALSETISKDLKQRGFKFVGPTIVYAFMQAVGMVNDHEINCAFRF